MFAAFKTLFMSLMSFTMLMLNSRVLNVDTFSALLFNCVLFLLYHFTNDCQFLILYLFTVCNLRELKLSTLLLNKVYCVVFGLVRTIRLYAKLLTSLEHMWRF